MNKLKDVTVITWNLEEFGIKNIVEEGYQLDTAYRFERSKIATYIRELWFKLGLPFAEKWYNKKLTDRKETMVVLDAMMNRKFLKWLAQKNPEAKLIFWYWNKITEKKVQPDELKEAGYEVWTFNELDRDKYHLKLNDTYYCRTYYEDVNQVSEEQEKYDVIFVGKDKGRMAFVDDLKKKNPQLKWYLHITANHFYERWKNARYQKNISYKENLELQKKSRAILEIVPSGSHGLTMRTMDALNQKKKLITNNPYVKTQEFYNENDFLVIDENTRANEIERFMEKEYMDIEPDIVAYFSFEQWIERFLQ